MSTANAFPFFQGPGGFPGVSSVLETTENQIWFGDVNRLYAETVVIDGSARDTGNTNHTTHLRSGLLMGRVADTGKLKQWDPLASDGTEQITHVLLGYIDAQRGGANADVLYYALRFADLMEAGVIIPGETAPGLVGKAYEFAAAEALKSAGFRLDRRYANPGAVKAFTANTTITDADHNKLLTNMGAAGAVTITLPAPKLGLRFRALSVNANNLILAAGSGNFIPAGANVTLNPAGDTCEMLGVAVSTGPTVVKYALLVNGGGVLS